MIGRCKASLQSWASLRKTQSNIARYLINRNKVFNGIESKVYDDDDNNDDDDDNDDTDFTKLTDLLH